MTTDLNNQNKLLIFEEHINTIENESNKTKFRELLEFVINKFPQLETAIKWNQPMFIDHGTYIIAFSVTKNHINIAPERAGMVHFDELIKSRGIGFTKMLIQMKWNQPIDFDLISKVVSFNIVEKAEMNSFWR